jgi:E3 ubiquitin-protein ligase RNF25
VLLLLGNHEKLEEGDGNCLVCRKPFHAKDLDHVLDLVGSHSSRVVSYLAHRSMKCKI